jgi:hypothetical protein
MAIEASMAPTMLGNSSRKPSPVLHDPAAVIENDRVDRGPMGLEGGVRTLLVGAHHAGVAGNVSADDGCQTSLHISCAPKLLDDRRNTSLAAGIQWL